MILDRERRQNRLGASGDEEGAHSTNVNGREQRYRETHCLRWIPEESVQTHILVIQKDP